jgi:hypothetical protein
VLHSLVAAVQTKGVETGGVLAGAATKFGQSPEDRNDPLLFEKSLLPDSSGWDPADGKDLIVSVPGGFNASSGNSLVARCRIRENTVSRAGGSRLRPGMMNPSQNLKRTYAAVHILREGQDVSRACVSHVALWHYTDKSAGQDQFYVLVRARPPVAAGSVCLRCVTSGIP